MSPTSFQTAPPRAVFFIVFSIVLFYTCVNIGMLAPLFFLCYTFQIEQSQLYNAGWSSLEARRAHNPKVIGSNPVPATRDFISHAQIAQLVEQRTENPRVTGSIPVLGIFEWSKVEYTLLFL